MKKFILALLVLAVYKPAFAQNSSGSFVNISPVMKVYTNNFANSDPCGGSFSFYGNGRSNSGKCANFFKPKVNYRNNLFLGRNRNQMLKYPSKNYIYDYKIRGYRGKSSYRQF